MGYISENIKGEDRSMHSHRIFRYIAQQCFREETWPVLSVVSTLATILGEIQLFLLSTGGTS